MLCPKCGRVMKNVKHFEKGKSYQFYRCECMEMTHPKRVHYDDSIETMQNYKKKGNNNAKEK